MSSKRLSMGDISKRLTRSQTRDKTKNNSTSNSTTSDPKGIGYNGVLGTNTTVPPFDRTETNENRAEAAEVNIEKNSYKAKTPSFEEAKTLIYEQFMQENKMMDMEKNPVMKAEDVQKFILQQGNIPKQEKTVNHLDYEKELKRMSKLLQESEENLRRHHAEGEIRRMAEKNYENKKKIENMTKFQQFQNQDSYIHYQNGNNVNDSSFFNKETSVDNLERRFHRFTKITKPRQTLNYFIGEFERLNVTDDHTKYNIIVGKWVPDEVSQYYRIVRPEKRNFQSFKEFFERRDSPLTPILGKPPVHTSSTSFSSYVAEATEWATAHEDDRIKFFLYHHAPSSLKSKMKKYFVEDLTQFKRRVQAIWSHQSDDPPVSDPSVNYNRPIKTKGHQQQKRRRNNGHYGYIKQSYDNSGKLKQNLNKRHQNYGNGNNYGRNFNNRNRNYINNSLNFASNSYKRNQSYVNNSSNRNQNYNNGGNYGHVSKHRYQNYGNDGNYSRKLNARSKNYVNRFDNYQHNYYNRKKKL